MISLDIRTVLDTGVLLVNILVMLAAAAAYRLWSQGVPLATQKAGSEGIRT